MSVEEQMAYHLAELKKLGFRFPGPFSNVDILDAQERQEIVVKPWGDNPYALQPCSIDLRLGSTWAPYGMRGGAHWSEIHYTLQPHCGINGSTLERIAIARTIKARVVGNSHWARAGLSVQFAGLVDANWGIAEDGDHGAVLTLELFNSSDEPITLESGVVICQIEFERTVSPAYPAYGESGVNSHYQGAQHAEGAKFQGRP